MASSFAMVFTCLAKMEYHTEPLPTGPIPRLVGEMDSDGLLWAIGDAEIGDLTLSFSELAVHLMITDGCGCPMQY